jgi:hypothetical protein
MDGIGRRAVGKLGARELKPDFVGPRLQIYKSFEVSITHRPAGWWKGIVKSADNDGAI